MKFKFFLYALIVNFGAYVVACINCDELGLLRQVLETPESVMLVMFTAGGTLGLCIAYKNWILWYGIKKIYRLIKSNIKKTGSSSS